MMGEPKTWYCTTCRETLSSPPCAEQEPCRFRPKPDMVQLPEHYAQFKIEPYRFIEENNLPFLVGCIIKYACRFGKKNGPEDVEKAERCCRMLVKKLKGDPDFWKKEKVTYETV